MPNSGWNKNGAKASGSARIWAEVRRRRYNTTEFDTGTGFYEQIIYDIHRD